MSRRRLYKKKRVIVPVGSTALLLHFNSSLIDSVNGKYNVSGSISQYQSAKFGYGAYLNDNKLTYDTSSIDFSGDWTVDFWWQDKSGTDYTNDNTGFFTNTSYNRGPWTKRGLALRWIRSTQYSENIFRVYFNTSLSSSNEQYIDLSPAFGSFKDKLHHIAMVKKGATGYIFIDGVLKGTRAGLSANDPTCENLTIGDWTNGNSSNGTQVGLIDEFRVSDIARWTSNFTPPTSPYVVD